MLRQRSFLSLLSSLNRRTCHFGSSTHILVRSDSSYKFNRYYSKKSSSGAGKDEGSTKTSRVIPSAATPSSCKTPPVQECQPTNQVKTCPPPASQYDDGSASSTIKNYNKRLLAAALLTAGTVYSIWKLNSGPEEGKKPGSKQPKKNAGAAGLKIPATSSEIPSSVPYLLVGGGTASFAAFRAIKSVDAKAKVLIIGNESYLPYMRPPLSKEMWYDADSQKKDQLTFKQWNGSEKSLFYEPEDFYIPCNALNDSPKGGVAVAQGWKVERIDPFNRIAYLEDGHEIKYEKCLLATGATPKTLDVFEKAPKEVNKYISKFRGIPDYLELNKVVKEAESVAIVGGGFLGSELACALARRAQLENPKMKVYQIFKEPGNMHKVLPEYLSAWTTKKVAKEGVEILSSSEVQDVSLEGKRVSLHLKDGKRVKADKVIVAVGVDPNTELADKSGLEVDPELGGFLVNAELEARSNLYAAGDCSCFYDVKFGRRRVEHHDHAVISGRLAGENMVGAGKPYSHQSMFWSDLGPDVGFEAIGIVDSSLPTVAVFAKPSERDNPKAVVTESDDNIRSNSEANNSSKPVSQSSSQVQLQTSTDQNAPLDGYEKGVIFYLKDDLVVGIVLWNVFRRMSVARKVLKDNRKYEDLNEVAKLFNIFDNEM